MVTIDQLASATKPWYLASPFSSQEPQVRKARLGISQMYSAYLMSHGVVHYAAIHATSHLGSQKIDLPFEHDFWIRQNKMFIDASPGVLLCNITGLYGSRGCDQEVHYAASVGLPIYLVTLEVNSDGSAYSWDFSPVDLALWESRVIAHSPIDKSTPKPV